jgi:3-dehydroquinate synthase
MKDLTVDIPNKNHTYKICIGNNIFNTLNTEINWEYYSKVAIISDKNIYTHYKNIINDNLPHNPTEIIVEAGEEHKNLDTVQQIWDILLKNRFDRKSLIINLGGGVVCDMGAFTASTYMRGIDFIQIPTTLLAQVDASIGGKTGVNFGDTKNIIGLFKQPKMVLIDIQTLKTLPKREFYSGFAEIIKHGLIADEKYFDLVTTKRPENFSDEELNEIIYKSCQIKANIVKNDEMEIGLRKTLNFGHTVGHAVETLSHKTKEPLLHGEAISVGIMAETKVAEYLGYIDSYTTTAIENALKKANLPVQIVGMTYEDIKQKMLSDKKNEAEKIKWTLLKSIGEADYNIECGEKFIKQAVEYIIAY